MSLHQSSSSHPSIPAYFPDGEIVFIPASAGSMMSSSSPALSFLDPFGLFSSPDIPQIPPPPPPKRLPSPPVERSPPSVSPLLLLGAGVTGVTLLATGATSLLLRRSFIASLTRAGQGRERTLEGIRRSLARVEDRLAGLEEGRVVSSANAGGSGGQGGEGAAALRELREEIEGMRKDLEWRMFEMEEVLRESRDQGGQEDAVVAAGPPGSNTETSAPGAAETTTTSVDPKDTSVPARTSASSGLAAFKDKLLHAVEGQGPEQAITSPAIPAEVKTAIDSSQAKIDLQTAKAWIKAFDKMQTVSPPVVSVEGSAGSAWRNAFEKPKVEDVVGPMSASAKPEVDTISGASAELVEDATTQIRVDDPPAASIEQVFSDLEGADPSPSTTIPISLTAGPDQVTFSEPTIALPPRLPAETSAPLSASIPVPESSTLAKDLDLAASISSKIDQHWYSAKFPSASVNNPTHVAEKQKQETSVPEPRTHKTTASADRPTTASNSDTINAQPDAPDTKPSASSTGHGRKSPSSRRKTPIPQPPSPPAAEPTPPPTSTWHVTTGSWSFPPLVTGGRVLLGGGFSVSGSGSTGSKSAGGDGGRTGTSHWVEPAATVKAQKVEREKSGDAGRGQGGHGQAFVDRWDREAIFRKFRERIASGGEGAGGLGGRKGPWGKGR